MADLDFPSSPSDGDTYEGYVYNAAKGVWQWQTLSPSLVSLTDTTITSPSSGEVLEYDGTNWVNAAGAVGGLVAVESVLKIDTFSASVGAGGNVAVTDLSITHEVSDPANKLIISAFFGVAANSDEEAQTGIAVHDGSSLIAVGAPSGSRTSLSAGGRVSTNGNPVIVSMPSITFVHTPGSGSKTYTVRAINVQSGTRTVYVNRASDDRDVGNRPRGVSSLVIQEVAV